MEDLGDLKIEVVLEQQGALRIRSGQTASFSFESLRGVKVEGRVESIFSKDNQFVVKLSSQELPPEVLPGMSADVVVTVGEKKGALLVPINSISNGQISKVVDGKKRKVNVKVGAIDGEWAEILEGELSEGDVVAVYSRN